jgi:hypothetical protein
MAALAPSTLICADWSGDPRKRSLYVADVTARVVRRLDGDAWTVGSVFAEADRSAQSGQRSIGIFHSLGGEPTTNATSA